MKKKLLFIVFAILLLTPWPVAYAYDNTTAGTAEIKIAAAEPPAAPGWNAYGGAVGGVSRPGDLFYIDSTSNGADTVITLYLTNAEDLIHYYRYLILKVGAYVQTDTDQWQEAKASSGQPVPETYITLRNGLVSFTLPGYSTHKVTIDSGSFYLFKNAATGSDVSPRFYITAEEEGK